MISGIDDPFSVLVGRQAEADWTPEAFLEGPELILDGHRDRRERAPLHRVALEMIEPDGSCRARAVGIAGQRPGWRARRTAQAARRIAVLARFEDGVPATRCLRPGDRAVRRGPTATHDQERR